MPHAPQRRLRASLSRGLALCIALTGCQAAGPTQAQTQPATAPPEAAPAPPSADAMLDAVPPCQANGAATLRQGLVVHFDGADPRDPLVCLVSWKGRTYRYLAGFWGSGRYRRGTAEERDAVRKVLLGPVGAKAAFEDVRAGLWGRVTAEHVGDPMLPLKSGPRRTVLVRMVKHDVGGRPQVRAETLHWIDARTGIALKRQVVTRQGNGKKRVYTTWRVEQLDGVAS